MIKISWKFRGPLAYVAGALNWLRLVRVEFQLRVDALPPAEVVPEAVALDSSLAPRSSGFGGGGFRG